MQHCHLPVPRSVASSDQHPRAVGGCRHPLPCKPFTAGTQGLPHASVSSLPSWAVRRGGQAYLLQGLSDHCFSTLMGPSDPDSPLPPVDMMTSCSPGVMEEYLLQNVMVLLILPTDSSPTVLAGGDGWK